VSIAIAEIKTAVAEHFNVPRSVFESQSRKREHSHPRQVAMYVSRQITTRSLPQIGAQFGGRDHTTVIHAIKTIQSDAERQQEADMLCALLDAARPKSFAWTVRAEIEACEAVAEFARSLAGR